MSDDTPRWEEIREPNINELRAICEPEGYCADGHRCGKIDHCFSVFTESFSEVWATGISGVSFSHPHACAMKASAEQRASDLEPPSGAVIIVTDCDAVEMSDPPPTLGGGQQGERT